MPSSEVFKPCLSECSLCGLLKHQSSETLKKHTHTAVVRLRTLAIVVLEKNGMVGQIITKRRNHEYNRFGIGFRINMMKHTCPFFSKSVLLTKMITMLHFQITFFIHFLYT